MSILAGQGLGKYFGAQDVFRNVEFSVAHGDKIALVGPNGAGKTTLLRIILGFEEPSEGRVQRARGLRIGYLPQKPTFPSAQTLYGEMLSVFEALRQDQHALQALAEEMANAQDPTELMERYAVAEQRFDAGGGYTYENRIRRVLGGLSFGPETYDWPIAVLSGGQVTRALLAKLLLQEPELLILDEPTNYLDLQALEWLETYLKEWRQSLLIVSHDRYFLDQVVSRVWEMNHGTLETYRGNYSSFITQKQALMLRRQREYEEQQEKIAETEEFVRRYKSGQRAKEARGRETRLERLERIEVVRPNRQMHLHMSATLRAGDQVLLSEGAVIGYETRPEAATAQSPAGERHALFNTGAFLLQRGQRIALLGPNGSGKTTFLRTVLSQIEPLEGHIRIGASVKIGYLAQNQDWLDPSKTILEQILPATAFKVEQARTFLGRFLFSGEEVYKQIGTLSGGELSRVALATLAIKGANFLLLDEPTTHLDVEAQEVLQEVLVNFNGTLLFVSHDRYLIEALATHVWIIQNGRLRQFEGNYSAYLAQLEKERAERAESASSESTELYEERRRRERQAQRETRKRVERAEALEAEVARLEEELTTVTGLLDLASANHDVTRLQELSHEYERLEKTLAARLEDWERHVSAAEGED